LFSLIIIIIIIIIINVYDYSGISPNAAKPPFMEFKMFNRNYEVCDRHKHRQTHRKTYTQ